MYRTLLFTGLLFALFSSCVGIKKYQEAEYMVEQGERRERQLRAQLEYAEQQIDYLTTRNGDLDQIIGVLRRDKANLESDTARLGSQIRALGDQSRMTQAELNTTLADCTRELETRNRQLNNIQNAVANRDDRLNEAFTMLRDSLDTIPGPPAAEVVFQDGKVVVSFSDQLLFGGSSINTTSEGLVALGRIAAIFNRFPDLEVTVLGHTANGSAPRGYTNNWDLSARRAIAAVTILTDEFDVSPNQLTVAGKGESLPKVSNESPEGRETNRRMEFILSPRLDMLYRNILQNGP